MAKYTGTMCPSCGLMTLMFHEWPSCVDGWEVLMASCDNCEYDVIRGFRRMNNIPDEDGRLTIMFAKPICPDEWSK